MAGHRFVITVHTTNKKTKYHHYLAAIFINQRSVPSLFRQIQTLQFQSTNRSESGGFVQLNFIRNFRHLPHDSIFFLNCG